MLVVEQRVPAVLDVFETEVPREAHTFVHSPDLTHLPAIEYINYSDNILEICKPPAEGSGLADSRP